MAQSGACQNALVRQHGQRDGDPRGALHRAPGDGRRHAAGHRAQIRGDGKRRNPGSSVPLLPVKETIACVRANKAEREPSIGYKQNAF